MKVRIINDRIINEECIACGVCADIAPAIFKMGEDAARVKADDVPEPEQEAVREAAESCPTGAIVIEG